LNSIAILLTLIVDHSFWHMAVPKISQPKNFNESPSLPQELANVTLLPQTAGSCVLQTPAK